MTEPENPRPTGPGGQAAPEPTAPSPASETFGRIGQAMTSVVRRTEQSLSPWARQMLLAPPEPGTSRGKTGVVAGKLARSAPATASPPVQRQATAPKPASE